MKYNKIIELAKQNKKVGDYKLSLDDSNNVFCTHKIKSKSFIITDEFEVDLFNVVLYSEKQNLIDSFINYSSVSEMLCGTKRTINSNRIPNKHSIAVSELRIYVEKWIDKYKKGA